MALTSQGKSPPTPGADDVGLIRKSTKLARSGMLRSGLRQGFLCCDLDGAQAHWLEIGCGMKRLMLLTGFCQFHGSNPAGRHRQRYRTPRWLLPRIYGAIPNLAFLVSALGSMETPQLFNSVREVNRFLISIERSEMPAIPERVDHLATMPSQDPERTVEAVRRALPELAKLDRYESRAAARLDRAIQEIIRNRIKQ